MPAIRWKRRSSLSASQVRKFLAAGRPGVIRQVDERIGKWWSWANYLTLKLSRAVFWRRLERLVSWRLTIRSCEPSGILTCNNAIPCILSMSAFLFNLALYIFDNRLRNIANKLYNI